MVWTRFTLARLELIGGDCSRHVSGSRGVQVCRDPYSDLVVAAIGHPSAVARAGEPCLRIRYWDLVKSDTCHHRDALRSQRNEPAPPSHSDWISRRLDLTGKDRKR